MEAQGQKMKVILVSAIILLSFGLAFSESQENDETNVKDETAIMDSWFKTATYDNRVRPNIREGQLQINISMYVLDFIDFDHEKDEFTIQVYLRQNWQDERLEYEAPEGVSSITLNAENSKKLWIPDTFIVNERRSKWHDVTTENEFTRVYPDGRVLRSIRLTVTASCEMDLKYFPFDTNSCCLEIESYAYTMEDYYYTWEIRDDEADIGSNGHNKEMKFLGQRAEQINLTLSTGTYSRLSAEFLFERESYPYIRDVYIPTALITSLTFITLTVGSPQFRVLLSIVCLVGLLLVRLVASELIPSESTALNFYVGTGFFMITLTILANFLAYHVLKRAPKASSLAARNPDAEGTDECSACAGTPEFESKPLKVLYTVCELCKYILPVIYIVFNIWYWLFLSIASSVEVDESYSQ